LAVDRWFVPLPSEFLTIIEDKKLLENVRARSAELRAGLAKLAAKFDFIREIRGEGLILASSFPSMAIRSPLKLCARA